MRNAKLKGEKLMLATVDFVLRTILNSWKSAGRTAVVANANPALVACKSCYIYTLSKF
jgi:hypothetical protein